ncbi:MAG: hypothetical protein AAF849_16305 [Bacteroidota bacterium]
MKTKLVLWGKDAEEKRVLTAIELKAETNTVGTYIFPEEVATDDFANEMMQKWRDGKEVNIPENHIYSEQPLSVTEGITPEGLQLERQDLLMRAQTEWHFVVLSSKLHDVYQSELSDLSDKIQQLKKYDGKVWGELKTFWNKVREQIKDQNLFREHADKLQKNTNELFDQMKALRAKMEEGFQAKSKELSEQFNGQLEEIEKRIGEGSRLSSVFEDLKALQRKFREGKFTRDDRSKVWKRLDDAFKAVKEKRFGPQKESDNSASGRLNRRLDGLLGAMGRMEKSIKRDKDDLAFQERKIATTDGQLEAQIRQAKVKMIEERIRSKQERFDDMIKTKAQIERQIEKQKERDAKRAEREKIEQAKKAAEAKIDEQIATAAAAMEEKSEELEKAAEAIKEKKSKHPSEPREESLLSAVGEVVSETLEDAGDTLKAVASVVGAKAMEKIEELKNAGKETMAEAKEKGAAAMESATKMKDAAMKKAKEAKGEAAEKIADASEKAAQAKDAVVEKAQEAKAAATEKVESVVENVTKEKDDLVAKAADAASAAKIAAAKEVKSTTEKVIEKADDTQETIADATLAAEESAAEALESAGVKVAEATEKIAEKAKEIKAEAAEIVEETKKATEEDKIA